MKLEDQVTSLELSKKLKEIGVKQESLFYWSQSNKYLDESILIINYRSIFSDKKETDYQISKRVNDEFGDNTLYSAFTVAEIGELLPDCSHVKMDGKWQMLLKGNWIESDEMLENNEAELRGRLLIYLLEKYERFKNEAI